MVAPHDGGHTVEKIGGTSIADTAAVLRNVFIGRRTGADLYNRIFVVSAYAGITDRLIESKSTGEPGVYSLFAGSRSEWRWCEAIADVGAEMLGINREILGDHADRGIADDFIVERIEGVRSCLLDLYRLCTSGHFRLDEHLTAVREMLSALGEAHSARNTTLLLRQHGVNATFVDLTGWRDGKQLRLEERIEEAFANIDPSKQLPIVTGYARCRDGLLRRFDRGYSEVTFSRIAVLTGAKEAIIHKEFHLSSADPKIVGVDHVRTIGRTNYDVADQLSNMGLESVHPSAAKGLRQADIPLCVKNTFEPESAGTVIRGDYRSKTPRVEIVTGLRGVVALEFFEQDMVGVKGYDAAILEVLRRHKARIVSKTSNANTITHYLCGSMKAIKRVVADLAEGYPAAQITTRKVAIVSAIGSDLKLPGLTAAAVSALADAGIEVLGLQQPMRNVDVQFVLDEADFERAIGALHRELVEKTDGLSDFPEPVADRAA